jgi:hypothetical protein
MDVDGIQTPSKRRRTASGNATTSATIATSTTVQKTRPERFTRVYDKPSRRREPDPLTPPGARTKLSQCRMRSRRPRWSASPAA